MKKHLLSHFVFVLLLFTAVIRVTDFGKGYALVTRRRSQNAGVSRGR